MKQTSLAWLLIRMLVLVPLLGLVLFFPIAALFIWVGEHFIIGHLPSSLEAIVVATGVVFAFGLSAWLSWLLIIGTGKPSKLELAEAARENERHRYRLLVSDFDTIERHFGCPVPPVLRELYTNTEEVLREDFIVSQHPRAAPKEQWAISSYCPADGEALHQDWLEADDYFHFAQDGWGNHYAIDPKLSDPPVLFLDHEEGTKTVVCSSLGEFLKWPRTPAPQTSR